MNTLSLLNFSFTVIFSLLVFDSSFIQLRLLILTRLGSSSPSALLHFSSDLYSSLHHNAAPPEPIIMRYLPLPVSSPSSILTSRRAGSKVAQKHRCLLLQRGQMGERMLAYGGALAVSCSFLVSLQTRCCESVCEKPQECFVHVFLTDNAVRLCIMFTIN